MKLLIMMKKYVYPSLLVLVLFTVTFAVNLQAPLYGVYAQESNVGSVAVTIAFAAYVAGLLPTLLFLGGLSDRVGRKGPIIISLALGIAATALLVVSPSWTSLFVARLLLGVGTGLATTSGAAYMTELVGENKAGTATVLVTSATSLGFGSGALATSFSLSLYGPTLLPVSYIVLFILGTVLIMASAMMPKTDKTKNLSLFRLPVFPSGTWVYGLAMMLSWATTGMIIAVVPLELKALKLDQWIGLVIFLGIFVGFLCQPLARKISSFKSLFLGLIFIPVGFFVIILGSVTSSISLILIGSSITSASSYGFLYLSALYEFGSRDPKNRARATAGLFIYAYAGFSIPVVLSGVLADLFGVIVAMKIFMLFITIVTVFISMLCFFKRKHSSFNVIK
jgi:MFS family permease